MMGQSVLRSILLGVLGIACSGQPSVDLHVPETTLSIQPSKARVTINGHQRFAVQTRSGEPVEVVWSVLEANGGTIDDNGTYNAPSISGKFTVRATSSSEPENSVDASVEVTHHIEVDVSPKQVILEFEEHQRFQATVTGSLDPTVIWSVSEPSGGTINADGNYNSPSTIGTYRVTATSVEDSTKSDTATIMVRAPVKVNVSPTTASLEYGESLDFDAVVEGSMDGRVIWSIAEGQGGQIDQGGTFTAPPAEGTYRIVATSVADPRRSASAVVTVRMPISVRIEPAAATLEFGESRTFQAVVSGTNDDRVSWSIAEIGGGQIDSTGTYEAPSVTGQFSIVATSVADPRRRATSVVTVEPPVLVKISPASFSLEFGEYATFSASISGTTDARVRWSIDELGGGTIDEGGKYQAPHASGTFHVRATSLADPRRSDFSVVAVRPPVEVSVEPRTATLEFGETLTFTASVTGTTNRSVSWSVLESEGGRITAEGVYTAPSVEGTFHIRATSDADPGRSGTASVVLVEPDPIDLGILPKDRRTTWDPGVPGGIPTTRQVHSTLSGLNGDGIGDSSQQIQAAIHDAGAEYERTGLIQEVVLPAGTFRLERSLVLDRSGVVLRGQGTDTRLRYDGNQNDPAVRIGRSRWTDYNYLRGPWPIVADGAKGDRFITVSTATAENLQVGDILGIDEEDDPAFVRMGDGWYGKRQPGGDTHGPALRGAGLWRSVGTMIEVKGKSANGGVTLVSLRDPLHMNFRTGNHAQIFHLATPRRGFDEIQYSGLERLYLTGGTITTNNVSYCWIDQVEVDGNPGTPNVGSYSNPGGITGHSIELFHAYRCEVRRSYIHHSRNIAQGGGAYLVALNSYTSESLIEDNIVVFGNKLIVGNMMGGGNVIAYNYVDNARTSDGTWQEGAIDLNHLAFTHNALVEGNWTSNMGADTTHGNSGWHVFLRNFASGKNTAPVYGSYPYVSAPDRSFMRAVGVDGYNRESTFIGNVLHVGSISGVYQIDHVTGPLLNTAAIWRIGGAVDGRGEVLDDGTALSLLYRHGNWDSVSGRLEWDSSNLVRNIPASMYLTSKPAFFGSERWPWVEPEGSTEGERVSVLPAKARYDALHSP